MTTRASRIVVVVAAAPTTNGQSVRVDVDDTARVADAVEVPDVRERRRRGTVDEKCTFTTTTRERLDGVPVSRARTRVR
jgi:hypothetical protein